MRQSAVFFMVMVLVMMTAACAGAPPPTATATAVPAEPTPEPTPTHSAETILATWREEETLSRTHLLSRHKLNCEACHADADAPSDTPSDALCLDCHEGSLEKLVANTNSEGEEIHPLSHLQTTSCIFCHTGHEPYQDPCQICHE